MFGFGIASIPTPVWVGVLGFALVLLLRLSGLIVGPTAVVLAAICLILAPGPSRLSDRFVVFFAIGFGWLTLLGWIPRLETTVDVPGITLAILFGLAAANQVHNRRIRLSLRQWPLASETAAIIIGTAATLWWAVPLLRLNLSGRLASLFEGWDNAAFFDMFRQILIHGSFKSIPQPGPGEGLPQNWTLLVRLWSPHPPSAAPWVLNAYFVVLLLTLGAIVTLGCLSVARLIGRDVWVALPAMAAVVLVFVVGRLWIFNGYPTFDLPIAAAIAAIIMSWRTTLRPWLNFFTVAGLALVAAYTWYPITILCAPAVIVTAVRLIKASSGSSQTLRTLFALACTGVAFMAPLVHFRGGVGKFAPSYAASGVNAVAIFTPGTPWVLVGLTVAGLITFAVGRRFKVGDGGLGLLAAPAVIGGLGVAFLAVTEISSSHNVSYYGHKFATGVFGMALIVLVTALVGSFATSKLRRRLWTTAIAGLACLASIALLEIDGYVGPVAIAKGATLATGFKSHQSIQASNILFGGEAGELIASAQLAQDRSASGTRWAFIDPDSFLNCGLADEWFYALSSELVLTTYGEWSDFPCRAESGDSSTATYLVSEFRNPISARVHLFVSASLARAIIAGNKAWNAPGVLNVVQTP
jgi:hypothetical protein